MILLEYTKKYCVKFTRVKPFPGLFRDSLVNRAHISFSKVKAT